MSTGVSHFSQVQMERMTPTKRGGKGKICCFPVIRELFLESQDGGNFFLSKPRWHKLITTSPFLKIQHHKPNKHLYHHSEHGNTWAASGSGHDWCWDRCRWVVFFSGCGDVKWTTLRYKGRIAYRCWMDQHFTHLRITKSFVFFLVVDVYQFLVSLVFFGEVWQGWGGARGLHKTLKTTWGKGLVDFMIRISLKWFYTLGKPPRFLKVGELQWLNHENFPYIFPTKKERFT